MNLQLHLLMRIALVAVLCLLLIASFLLVQTHRQAEQTGMKMAETVGKQLESQLLLIQAGIGQRNPFPDFEFWKQSGSQPGVCLSYVAADGVLSRSLCNGTKPADSTWPDSFGNSYKQIFSPGRPLQRPVGLPGKGYGVLTVTPSAELEIAEAWNKTLSLMALSSATVLSVCLLVYLNISRALQPAKIIVTHLNKMETGDLAIRLPDFDLSEWRQIASAINQLAASQQQLLAERQKLLSKLMEVQEQERRYLASELHDEYGQCLAAINAVATSIKQTAAQQCPEIVDEANQVSRITAHLLQNMRGLLIRLRPAEFDELGLAASLNSLITGWNRLSAGKTRYQFSLEGDCALLTEYQAFSLFRIAQEALTNIAKHAAASRVSVFLQINAQAAHLTVTDNGVTHQLPFSDLAGIGLLGIRERLTAINGQLQLRVAKPHGLVLEAELPIHQLPEQPP